MCLLVLILSGPSLNKLNHFADSRFLKSCRGIQLPSQDNLVYAYSISNLSFSAYSNGYYLLTHVYYVAFSAYIEGYYLLTHLYYVGYVPFSAYTA